MLREIQVGPLVILRRRPGYTHGLTLLSWEGDMSTSLGVSHPDTAAAVLQTQQGSPRKAVLIPLVLP